ncbi:MAG: thioesterase [Flavobacteriaceae bacterium]|nr:thioesterase [Flavobacteriaceae bacterium]
MKYSPFSYNFFTLIKLPAAWISGVRVSKVTDKFCEVKVRHRWINQNPFKSMYWAVQGMAAELTTGIFLIERIRSNKTPISMLVLNNKANFKKKARGVITFRCDDGLKANKAIDKAIQTRESSLISMRSVGKDYSGDIVSEFIFEWTIKAK